MQEIVKYFVCIGAVCLILWFSRKWLHEGLQKYKHRKHIKENDSDPDCVFCRKDLEKKKRKREFLKQQQILAKGGD